MAKSRKRNGQKKHNQRISERKKSTLARQNAVRKLFEESMKTQIEELKKNAETLSASTENK